MSVKTKQQRKPPKQSNAKPPVKQVEPVETVEQKSLPEIKFDDAVEMGRTFVANIKLNEWELGSLAARVEPKYGDKTLAKFAEEINFPLARLNRCRSVVRAYSGTDFEGTTPKFAPAQAITRTPAYALARRCTCRC